MICVISICDSSVIGVDNLGKIAHCVILIANGLAVLSPMFDKLFDRGFITFTSNRHVILSEFLSSDTWKRIGIKNNDFIMQLPMDEKRIEYLKFHHQSVFKGTFEN